MQTVDQLFTNTTNRHPLCIAPIVLIPQTPALPSKSQPAASEDIKYLFKRNSILEQQLADAKQQHKMMLQLFEQLGRIERGEKQQKRKLQRRCHQDILDRHFCAVPNCNRFYSSETSLQRHVKLKHNSVKNQPPQLYRDLQPGPNLMQLAQSSEEVSSSHRFKLGEASSDREET